MEGGGGGQKPAVQPLAVVLSGTQTPTSPSRTGGKGATYRSGSRRTSPRLPSNGPSHPHLAAPDELPMSLVAPVKQVALKQKKGYHLVQQTLRHPHRRVVSKPTVGPRGGSGITSALPLKTSQTCLTSYLLSFGSSSRA